MYHQSNWGQKSVIYWMFVSPPNSLVEALISNLMCFGVRVFGRIGWGWWGWGSMKRLVFSGGEEETRAHSLTTMGWHSKKATTCRPGRRLSLEQELADILVMALPAFTTVKCKCLLLNTRPPPPVYGILLQQS